MRIPRAPGLGKISFPSFTPRYLASLAVLLSAYFIAGKLGLKLATIHPSASPVWPPTGVALAALLIFGFRVWPAILLGAFLVNLTTAGNVATSIGIAIGNTLEALAGAYLVTLAARGRLAFEHTGDLFRFVLFAGILATTLSATFGVTSLAVAGFAAWSDYVHIWLTWWLGDAMGALIVAPVLILWSLPSPVKWRHWRVLEVAVLFITLGVLGLEMFTQPGSSVLNTYPVKFLTFPFLLWAAVRFGQREAATAVAVLCAVAMWGHLHAVGPFVQGPPPNEGLILLQVFMAVMSAATLGVGTAFAERRRAEYALRETLDKLELKVEERTQALRESEKSLQELSGRLLRLQDEERHRIAQELHENTGQKLAALSMNLSLATREAEALSPKARHALQECFTLADESVREMRTLSYLLHPPFLDELGLGAALRWYAEGFAHRSGVRVNLEMPEQSLRASKDAQTTLFRIVQECLTNVHRHGEGQNVTIRLYAADGALKLEVEDLGNAATEKRGAVRTEQLGVGVRGMRERVRQLEGHLEFHWSEQGATVRVSLPLRKEEQEPESAAGATA